MKRYQEIVLNPETGAAIEGATVTVFTGGAAATIFADGASTPKANPTTTDENGSFFFYAANGTYSLTISYMDDAGISTELTFPDIEIYDLDELFASIAATAADRDLARAYAISDTNAAIPGAVSITDRGARYEANRATSASGVASDVLDDVNTVYGGIEGAFAAKDIAVAAAAQATGAVAGNNPQKFMVDLATTYPFNGQISGFPIIDGVQTIAGHRVGDWNNTNKAFRGIWVAAAGNWTRAADCDTAGEISSMTMICRGGTVHYGRQFNCLSAIITLGTDPIEFEPVFSGAGNLTEKARQRTGVNVHVGDSNTVGRVGTHIAYMRGRGHPHLGAWRNWIHYDMADSGMKLAAIVGSIPTGDRNQAPVDFTPGLGINFGSPPYSGNIWMIVNALNQHSNAICEVSLGINDFGLGVASRAPGGSGDPDIFRANMRTFIAVILTHTNADIILRIPQPFGGDADFIVGPTNTTEWLLDSPDATIATNAANTSAKMIGVYREFIGRNPRVTVIDMPKLVYGADRCDNPVTDCLDQEVGATFNGTAVSAVNRKLIADTLHSSDLGERREEESITRFLGLSLGRGAMGDYFIAGPRLPWRDIFDGEWINFEQLTNSAGDTSIKLRGSPEALGWRQKIDSILTSSSGFYGPTHDLMIAAERYLFTKRPGVIKRLTSWQGEIKFWFPVTGNTYTATDITFSSETTDTGDFAEKFFTLFAKNVNMGAELAAARGPDLGYPGSVQLDEYRQICFIYITDESFDETRKKHVTIPVVGTLGSSPCIFTAAGVGSPWIARQFECARTDNSPTTPTITLSIANQGDGRLVVNGPVKAGCSISGTTLTTPDGVNVVIGQTLSGAGVTAGTVITAGSGTTWTVNNSQTVGPISITFQVNFATGEGMPIGTFTFASGNRVGVWTPNTTNIDLCIGTGIGWFGVAGSNWVTLFSGYHFRAKADSALGNPAQVVISS